MHGLHITLPLPIPPPPKEHLKLRSSMHIWTSNRRMSKSNVLTKQRAIYAMHTWGSLKIRNHFLFLAVQKQNIRADIVFHLWVGRRRREGIPAYVFSCRQNNTHLSYQNIQNHNAWGISKWQLKHKHWRKDLSCSLMERKPTCLENI